MLQDNIFNSGGHVAYPRCEVEPLQIVQAGLEVHEHVDGLDPSDIRRPLMWKDLEAIMETIQKPAVLVVRKREGGHGHRIAHILVVSVW